jgi:hypothetical protein
MNKGKRRKFLGPEQVSELAKNEADSAAEFARLKALNDVAIGAEITTETMTEFAKIYRHTYAKVYYENIAKLTALNEGDDENDSRKVN